jgi:hypothetical protein
MDSLDKLPNFRESCRQGSSVSDNGLGFYRKCPHERKLITMKMLAGTFDRILLNEADSAADAGNYGNLWVLNGVFGVRLELGRTKQK